MSYNYAKRVLRAMADRNHAGVGPSRQRCSSSAASGTVGRRGASRPACTPSEPELSRWMVFFLKVLHELGPQHALILLSVALLLHPPALTAPTVAAVATGVWTSIKLMRQGDGAVPAQQRAASSRGRRA
ncbi:MAG: hypothetical protein ACJ8GN_13180 [Longimicrobiaceae bacterium]